MLKNISNLGAILEKNDLKELNGGRADTSITVSCTFSDGLGYELTYNNHQSAFLSLDYCFKQGGSGSVNFN